ncbi:hypothetical protein BRC66_01515 [Halobacteriales archaeon QH_2_66_30]|nr:MAG: hypothetical protein BRC66_01515 [Halobacteriales archaeon QH_2_66_30]
MDDALRERVEALERAVTDGEHDLSAVADEAAALDRLETLESDVADLADRLEELEAATQALRGYVGNVRSVNTDVEQRADAALAKAEALEDRLPGTATTGSAPEPPSTPEAATADDEPGDDDPADKWEWGTSGHTDGTPAANGAESTARAGNGDATGEEHATDAAHASNQATGRGSETPQATGRGSETPQATGRQQGAPRATDRQRISRQPAASQQPADSRHGTHKQTGGQRETRQRGSGTGTQASDHRCDSCGRPHGQHSLSQQPTDATPGAPTVEALAASDPSAADGEGSVTREDGDVLPDGADDPLVGAGEGDREAGTLQRIRDLL